MSRGPFNHARVTALLTLLVFAAALLASGCGDKAKSSSVPPEERVQTALKNASEIKSGKADIEGTIATSGMPGSFKLSGSGSFDTQAKGGAAFDLKIKVNVAGFDQTIGLIAVDGKNYISIGDQTFENTKGDSSGGALEPGAIQDLINSLNKYVSNVKQVAGKTVNGESLDVYSMTIDLGALAKDSAGKSNAKGASIPGLGNVSDLAKSLGKAQATVGIGSDDLPHEIGVNATVGASEGGDSNGGGIKGTLVLSDINKPVTIAKPTNVVTDNSALQALGGMLGGLSGGQ